MKKIQILLIEDNKLLRDGILAILKKQSDMHVVGTVGNEKNVLMLMDKVKPSILLLDLSLGNQNSKQLVDLSRQHYPDTKIIVMDIIPLQLDVFEFVEAGIAGFILKDASIAEFLKTIRSVYQGAHVLPPHLTGSLFTQIVQHAINGSKRAAFKESVRMTTREKQVMELIANGDTNKEIAQKLNLSTYTVKSHVHNILEKLALSTRVQIARHTHLSDSFKSAPDNSSLIDE